MERAGKTIAKLRNIPGISSEQLALNAWSAAIGQRLAARAVASSLVRDRLVVDVEDAVWQRQLHHLRGAILAKLTDLLGAGIVNDIEFRIRRPSWDVPRRPPQRAPALDPASDADGITDPVFRILYKGAKKKAGS